jgi:glycosyltransferase involved in cell wall biosynthesis
MKLIFLNRFFFPDVAATSQLLSDLVFDLVDDGYEAHVITGRHRYDDVSAQLPAQALIKGVRVHRVWTTHFGRAHLAGIAVNFLTFYITAAWKLLFLARKDDVVVVKTDPPLISVVVSLIAALRGATVVNWVQDLFPEVAIELNVKALRGKRGRLLRWMRNRALSCARVNVVLGKRMSDRMALLNVAPDRVRIIHNWADGKVLHPVRADENSLRKEWGLDGRFVVGYSGNLGRAHDFSTLLGAMERLQEDERIVFLVIGDGPQLEWVKSECTRRGLTNVVFKPYQPRELLYLSLSAADVHIISLQTRLEGLIVPSKFYGIAAVGRPALYVGAEDGEIAKLIYEHEAGFVVSSGDDEALAERIAMLASDPADCEQLGRNARVLLERRFDRRVALKAWRDVLSGVTVGKSAVSKPELSEAEA